MTYQAPREAPCEMRFSCKNVEPCDWFRFPAPRADVVDPLPYSLPRVLQPVVDDGETQDEAQGFFPEGGAPTTPRVAPAAADVSSCSSSPATATRRREASEAAVQVSLERRVGLGGRDAGPAVAWARCGSSARSDS